MEIFRIVIFINGGEIYGILEDRNMDM